MSHFAGSLLRYASPIPHPSRQQYVYSIAASDLATKYVTHDIENFTIKRRYICNNRGASTFIWDELPSEKNARSEKRACFFMSLCQSGKSRPMSTTYDLSEDQNVCKELRCKTLANLSAELNETTYSSCQKCTTARLHLFVVVCKLFSGKMGVQDTKRGNGCKT